MTSRLSLLAAALFVVGCTQPTQGPTGPTGATGPAGPAGAMGTAGTMGADGTSVTGTRVDAGSAQCPNGGVAITSANGTTYVCNGADGAPGAMGAPGSNGNNGISVGAFALDAGSTQCPNGGSAFVTASGTTYACNGANGAAGTPGTNGNNGSNGANGISVTTTPVDAGVDCPNGGVKLTSASGDTFVCNAPAGIADNGCPGPRVDGVCVLKYDNTQTTNFQQAAQACAFAGGDLCTDSQLWPIAVGAWQNQYLAKTLLNGAHWSASFADNDGLNWPGVNGGTGDDHSPNSSYGYACCGGMTPPNPRVTVQTINNVKVSLVHNVADTFFAGAVATCMALNSDVCSDSQTLLLRSGGALTVAAWTNAHSDNDAALYNSITGGTNDDTHPSYQFGFACCPSRRPTDLSCPVTRTSGVCATFINNTANTTFAAAAADCASRGSDLCSIAQSAVLRTAGSLSVPVWTNSHSDNDGTNATVGVGAMPDNPVLTSTYGYACCLN